MKDGFNLIARMRELQPPEPIAWWPPAPGWWLLLVLLAAGLILSWALWQRRSRLRRDALQQLQRIRRDYGESGNTQELLRELSALLRRIALARSPRNQVAHLTGKAWLNYLDKAGQSDEFTQGKGQIIAVQPYSNALISQSEVSQLLGTVESWIRRVT